MENFRNLNTSELLVLLEEAYLNFLHEKFGHFLPVSSNPENQEGLVELDITKWTCEERNVLFNNALQGIYYVHFVYSKKKVFPSFMFQSVKNSILGEMKIFLNLNGIKWFSTTLKEKIKKEGIDFPDKYITYSNYSNSSKNIDHSDGLKNYGGWEQDEMENYMDQ